MTNTFQNMNNSQISIHMKVADRKISKDSFTELYFPFPIDRIVKKIKCFTIKNPKLKKNDENKLEK